MPPFFGAWRRSSLKSVAVLCRYSAAVCDAVVVISQCNEILLKTALAFTHSFAFYLSALLRLNAFLRLTLSGVSGARRPPREEEDVDVDQRRHSCCSTRPRPLSRTSGDDVCSPVCWGGDTGAERVKLVRLVLPVVPTLCRGAVSVCSTVVALIHVAPSVLCANLRPGVSTAVTVCGCIRPVLFTVLTVTGYCTQLLDLPSL